jgi:hypothetical protein
MAITDKSALNNRRPYKVKEDFSNDAQFSKFSSKASFDSKLLRITAAKSKQVLVRLM